LPPESAVAVCTKFRSPFRTVGAISTVPSTLPFPASSRITALLDCVRRPVFWLRVTYNERDAGSYVIVPPIPILLAEPSAHA
jgi:hypothetical protein